MGAYISNETIKELRIKRGITQEQLADELGVTAKAVSKWETGRGLPDITLLEPLAASLRVSVAELITGDVATNANRSANVKRGLFHVCPICGNAIWSMGGISASCCGSALIALEAEVPDEHHAIRIEKSEGDHLVTIEHPMEKQHFISFVACVNDNQVRIMKLYPEQDCSYLRFAITGPCEFYAYCNRHGLFKMKP